MNKDNVYDLLVERGFVHTATHPAHLRAAFEKPTTFYLGIDPTADNLHIGHFFSLRIFKILQDHGHRGVLLIGNATAMVGDPSFKNDMRKLMSPEQIDHNAREINSILDKFIDRDRAIIVHNGDWIRKMGYVEFGRNVCQHLNVAEMLSHDCYKNRVGNGLTLFEMLYMPMQAYDFVHLNTEYGCTVQIGGSDQWANITAGVDLGRKMALAGGAPRPPMFGLCCPLLTKSDGTKMGKTEKGTLWVSRTADTGDIAYECYQHFYNVHDADVERLLTFFTDTPVDEIKRTCAADIIAAKRQMALAVTGAIHGASAATAAATTAAQLFAARTTPDDINCPTETVETPRGATIVDILALTSLAPSKRHARELVTMGAITVDGTRITDANYVPTAATFTVKKGKKTFLKIEII